MAIDAVEINTSVTELLLLSERFPNGSSVE
jgi:hypothetical protein